MYQHILVTLDGSPLAEQALPYAAKLAKSLGAHLTLLRAVPATATGAAASTDAETPAQAEAYLQSVRTRAAEAGSVETVVASGVPARVIVDAAKQRHADLIVLATHGRSGLGRWIYGSVADQVMRESPVPVVVVPATAPFAWPGDRAPRILVPLDGSDLARAALGPASELAGALHADLILVDVVEPHATAFVDPTATALIDPTPELEAAKAYLTQVAADLRAKGRVVEISDAFGFSASGIVDTAEEKHADLIVMASHGSAGLTRLVLGSVATGVIQRSHVPVVIIRPPAT